MNFQPWHYFLSLERDFIATLDYVELAPANGAAFSNTYVKLLQLISSEVDVVAKLICKTVPGHAHANNILAYQEALTFAFPGIDAVEVDFPRFGFALKPWESWAVPETSPDWWKAYNDVKHDRSTQFKRANQLNVSLALSGLLILLMYHYRSVDHLQPNPKLVDRGFPDTLVTGGHHNLPGITYARGQGGKAHWE